ncbi:hypothetical protein M5K25_008665 [Dendrobium thyrsiflorum]|uniref:Uncharacterized protein n=1 Tax=Dendrobium thyrsiflorum TaxID=117978 RepID=A0ABD0V9B7_DENTH
MVENFSLDQLSGLFCYFCASLKLRCLFFKQEMELSLIGLQNAGKTSLVNSISTGGYSEDMIPTVGFNMRKVTKGNVTIKLWDLGGQQRFRTMWERYCRGVSAIIHLKLQKQGMSDNEIDPLLVDDLQFDDEWVTPKNVDVSEVEPEGETHVNEDNEATTQVYKRNKQRDKGKSIIDEEEFEDDFDINYEDFFKDNQSDDEPALGLDPKGIYVVDAADRDSFPIARSELHELLIKPSLSGIPLLLLGNKIDKSEALSKQAVVEQMGLELIKDREVCCYMISCKESINIDVVMDWLIKHSRTAR